MKDIDYNMIPKRISYYLDILELPDNLVYHNEDENDQQINYTNEWCYNLAEDNVVNFDKIQLVTTDGSVKDGIGGFGFFSTDCR